MKDFMPIVAQDYQTGEIRMVGVGNEESTAISDKTWKLTFWSRTKWRLWTKGETSWDFLEIQDKQDTVCMSQNQQLQQSIIYRVKQVVWETGMTCHKGTPTCFWDGVFDIKFDLHWNDWIMLKWMARFWSSHKQHQAMVLCEWGCLMNQMWNICLEISQRDQVIVETYQ